MLPLAILAKDSRRKAEGGREGGKAEGGGSDDDTLLAEWDGTLRLIALEIM